MEIVVEGKGTKFFRPDKVVLNLTFKYTNDNYEELSKIGETNVINFINEILNKNNLSPESLKTRGLTIKENTEYNESTRKYEKNGYMFTQIGKLELDYDINVLSKILKDISSLLNPPVYNVSFGLKDEDAARKSLIKLAFEDAKKQAESISEAASTKLVECKKIDFKPINTGLISNTIIEDTGFLRQKMYSAHEENRIETFVPEDIELSQKIYCLWISE